MKLALISIKPEYAFKILFGQKKYEYRKVLLSKDVSHVIIYVTVPIQKIIGFASVKQIIQGSPSKVWETTKERGGVARSFYREYFKNKKNAYAIELENVYPLDTWINPSNIIDNFVPPQSFRYLPYDFLNKLKIETRSCRNIIFVGGIHGVGKSTICANLKNDLSIDSLTASQLIRREKKALINQNKLVNDSLDNQIRLIKQLKEESSHKRLLLDGHLTLINKKHEVEDIPLSIFQQINPSHIVLITSSTESIIERLKKRDNKTYDFYLIDSMSKREKKQAERISKALNIPLYIFSSNDYVKIKSTLSTIL